jgi:hypothetical protein
VSPHLVRVRCVRQSVQHSAGPPPGIPWVPHVSERALAGSPSHLSLLPAFLPRLPPHFPSSPPRQTRPPPRRSRRTRGDRPAIPQTMATATALMPSSPSPYPEGRPPKNPSDAPDSPVSPLDAAQAEAASGYEAEREARIRENVARMQKLGILDLVQSLTPPAASRCRGRPRKKPVEPGSIAASGFKPAAPSPARRSLRCRANHLLSRIRILFGFLESGVLVREGCSGCGCLLITM